MNGGGHAPTIHFNVAAQWRFEAKMLASFYYFRASAKGQFAYDADVIQSVGRAIGGEPGDARLGLSHEGNSHFEYEITFFKSFLF